jgi:arylsulfatase
VTLWAGDEQIGQGTMPHTVPVAFTSYAGMDVGCDNGLVVDLAYEDRSPYRFTGTIHEVAFELLPVSHEEAQGMHEHEHHQSVGHGVAG